MGKKNDPAASVFCACGAQWHGKYIHSAAIASHRERGKTGKLGCRIIENHADFASRYECQCMACDVRRAATRLERAKLRVRTQRA